MTWYDALHVAGLLNQPSSGVASELWERAAAGDRAAFTSLYRSHFAEVRAFAQRLLGCATSADDLVQEVFVSLPAALSRFRGECPVKSYLLAMTVRRAKTHLRSAQRRRKLEARALALAAHEHAATPHADAEQRELGALLTRALDGLPLGQRAAFVLCEVEERSSGEAAEILGERPGTVRARVFHAKRKLRERLPELAGSWQGAAGEAAVTRAGQALP